MGEDSSVDEDNSDVTPMEIDDFQSSNIRLLKCKSEGSPTGEAEVHLIGTLHTLKSSSDEVRDLIQRVHPEVVFLELCHDRLNVLMEPVEYKETTWGNLFSLFRSEHDPFTTLYPRFLAKVAAEVEVSPGEEFRVAVSEAKNCGAAILLGDRPVQVTILRMWARLSLWQKLKLFGTLVTTVFWMPKKDEIKAEMERLMSGDISVIIAEFGKEFPDIVETLITERDMYMSALLRRVAEGKKSVVAVVGKGHLLGIEANWERKDINIRRLLQKPKVKPWLSIPLKRILVGTTVLGVAIFIGRRFSKSV